LVLAPIIQPGETIGDNVIPEVAAAVKSVAWAQIPFKANYAQTISILRAALTVKPALFAPMAGSLNIKQSDVPDDVDERVGILMPVLVKNFHEHKQLPVLANSPFASVILAARAVIVKAAGPIGKAPKVVTWADRAKPAGPAANKPVVPVVGAATGSKSGSGGPAPPSSGTSGSSGAAANDAGSASASGAEASTSAANGGSSNPGGPTHKQSSILVSPKKTLSLSKGKGKEKKDVAYPPFPDTSSEEGAAPPGKDSSGLEATRSKGKSADSSAASASSPHKTHAASGGGKAGTPAAPPSSEGKEGKAPTTSARADRPRRTGTNSLQ
jgi:hypothetical protein